MQFTEIKTYDIIEESLVDGQLLCKIETDVNSVNYNVDSSTNQYFAVIDNKVFLTGDGKIAVNKDFPEDISKEIQHLEFTIIAVNTETDESISQNISIKVQRLIDNAPYVLNHYEHNMYTHNLYPGILSTKIDLVYNTYCSIVGINDSYFDLAAIPKVGTDNITITLNNNGINKYSNLDFDTLDQAKIELIENRKVYKHEIILDLIDATNNKNTVFSLYVKFVEGDQYQNLPTKNNLEIQAELLATKISDIATKHDKEINEYSFDISNIKRKVSTIGSQLNLNRTQINKLSALLIENISENKEVFKFTDDKIKVIVESNADMYSVIYKTVSEFLNTELNSDLENKANTFYKANNIEMYAKSEELSSKGFSEYLMSRTDTLVERRFENFTTTINDMFVNYNTLIFSNIISPANTKNNELAAGINAAFSSMATIGSNASKALTIATNADNNAATVSNRLSQVEVRKLEDWGTTSGWTFSGSNLNYSGRTVLTNSSTSTTLTGNNNVILYAGGESMIWSGNNSTLSFTDGTNTTVDAGVFTGTATQAKYADMAEYYKKEPNEFYNYEPGTILYLNRSKSEEDFEITEDSKGNIFAGVITTDPGFILNSAFQEDENYVCLALNGRVPVKCIGFIKKGMYLYPSHNNPNVAEGTYTYKNTNDLIGIAIQNSNLRADLEDIKLILSKVK